MGIKTTPKHQQNIKLWEESLCYEYDTIWYMIWYICKLQLGWHPVAVVQYTFTNKQYTEHNETEYTEQNTHNNKNT
jgi:hypothetical protein